jgi:nucleolar GTP-binding protein
VVLDPSGTCGYPLEAQRALRHDIEARFDAPVLSVANKIDRTDPDERVVLQKRI